MNRRKRGEKGRRTDDDPLDAFRPVRGSHVGDSAKLAGELVADFVRLVVLSVDSSNQAVL